jgi:mannitol/fructose-specific phosphotransferase system IIA component (Ntr-type)
MKLVDFVIKDAIVPELKATDRDGVIRELVQSLAHANAIAPGDVNAVVKAIIDREKTGSTGFGKGVAVPHVKHPAIKKRMAVVGRSAHGVDFAALDQAPVYSVIMLLSPPNNPDGHLQAMEKIFRSLQEDMFRRFLRQSDTQQKIWELIEEAE